MRVRHFGLLANRQRRALLDRCRTVLAAPVPAAPVATARESGVPCPVCRRGVMDRTALVAPVSLAAPTSADTS